MLLENPAAALVHPPPLASFLVDRALSHSLRFKSRPNGYLPDATLPRFLCHAMALLISQTTVEGREKRYTGRRQDRERARESAAADTTPVSCGTPQTAKTSRQGTCICIPRSTLYFLRFFFPLCGVAEVTTTGCLRRLNLLPWLRCYCSGPSCQSRTGLCNIDFRSCCMVSDALDSRL